MNLQYKKFLQKMAIASVAVVLFADASTSTNTSVSPYLHTRSSDLVGKVVGVNQHNHLFGLGSNYGTFDIRAKYAQTFGHKDITKMLFGPAAVTSNVTTGSTSSSTTTTIDADDLVVNISGSQVSGRKATDLEAEQFLLPAHYQSTLLLKPQAQQFKLGFGFYMGFDEWVEGLFFRVNGDFRHSRHDLKFQELNQQNASTDAGQLPGFAQYAQGNAVTAVSSNSFNGGSFQGLQYAKFNADTQTCNEFGDLQFELGYNLLLDEDYHMGVSGLFVAPTGKKPEGTWLFEPLGTNGGHFGLGGAVTSHYTMWRSEDEETHLDIAVDAEISHLFGAKQTRTFDLKNKPLSRYLLAKKMKPTVAGSLTAGETSGSTTPSLQFADVYAPVANISTQKVKSSFGVQADLTAMFTVVSRGWNFDLGYNFFGLSSEKLVLESDSDDASTFPANTWALAGHTYSYGTPDDTNMIALSGTASGATIFGNNASVIDSSTNAWHNSSQLYVGSSFIKTSSSPVTIASSDLDLEGAQNRQISHKVFTNVGYTWVDREDWVPFIGAGAEVELGQRYDSSDDATATTSTDSDDVTTSRNTARTQWGVWLKGGISFN